MKAVQLVAYGDAVEGVEVRDIAEPNAPGAGEALVATKYDPINFNDLMVVWGIYPWKPEPVCAPSQLRDWSIAIVRIRDQ